MKVEQIRPDVFTLVATSHELSLLIAAARMALDFMRDDQNAPPAAIDALERILRDYDAALGGSRSEERNGR
ncbi:MAG: hypothetical protein ACRDKU_01935 [Gaiellaceae bacterium]